MAFLSGSFPQVTNSRLDDLETEVDLKFNTPSGTTSQYVRGDGTLSTFPTIPTLPIDMMSVEGLQAALDAKASANHGHDASDIIGTKTSAFISDFVEAAQDAVAASLSPEFVYNDASNVISLRARSFNRPSRTVGTAFQISATQDADVVYSIPVSCSATLLVGSRATATLQYADNAAMTNNLVTLTTDDFGVGSGLIVTANGTLKLVGVIPAGKYVRVTTGPTLGTPTFGSLTSQEVLL